MRVLDNRGEGTDAQVLEGLDAVLASIAAGNPHGIRVVNMSLGGYFDDVKPPDPGNCDALAPDYKAAFDLLSQAGVLVVAASGNGGCTNGIVLPACVSNALAVGAVYDAAVGAVFFGRGQCLPTRMQRRHSRGRPDHLLLRLERPPRRPRAVGLRGGAAEGRRDDSLLRRHLRRPRPTPRASRRSSSAPSRSAGRPR